MSHRILRVLYLARPARADRRFLPTADASIVGVDGESLAASTGAPVNEINSVPCDEEGEDTWTCTYPASPEPDPDDPGPTTYEVTIDKWGCWTIGGVDGPTEPPDTTGCVTIMDHVSSID